MPQPRKHVTLRAPKNVNLLKEPLEFICDTAEIEGGVLKMTNVIEGGPYGNPQEVEPFLAMTLAPLMTITIR